RVGDAARDEVRRTALAHLTDTANRHGVEKAKCENCSEGVHVGMLVQPRCPHCDSSFSSLEPKTGFFRSSVLHTGTMPALESGPDQPDAETETLEAMVADAEADSESAPSFDMDAVANEPADEPIEAAPAEEEPEAVPNEPPETEPEADVSPDEEDTEATADGGGAETERQRDLEAIEGIGAAYADRLQEAGIEDLLALAVADPEDLGEALDVPSTTVAEWVEQADAMTGSS
ncbi:MAG: hypothetical protein U5J98_04110, partial [Halobacteriales archaeon]|nr:hypothetical protein [Halobacteriales archaeon]